MTIEQTNADLIKKMATDIVMLSHGHEPGLFCSAMSLALGSFAKNATTGKAEALELIERITQVAKEASQTK